MPRRFANAAAQNAAPGVQAPSGRTMQRPSGAHERGQPWMYVGRLARTARAEDGLGSFGQLDSFVRVEEPGRGSRPPNARESLAEGGVEPEGDGRDDFHGLLLSLDDNPARVRPAEEDVNRAAAILSAPRWR